MTKAERLSNDYDMSTITELLLEARLYAKEINQVEWLGKSEFTFYDGSVLVVKGTAITAYTSK